MEKYDGEVHGILRHHAIEGYDNRYNRKRIWNYYGGWTEGGGDADNKQK